MFQICLGRLFLARHAQRVRVRTLREQLHRARQAADELDEPDGRVRPGERQGMYVRSKLGWMDPNPETKLRVVCKNLSAPTPMKPQKYL